MARPRKQPTVTPELLISILAEKQCSNVEIAARLGISVDTLMRRYAEEISKGKETGKSKLREKLFDTALGGNTTALIFACKAILGLKETSAVEVSGANGGPIETTNLRALSDDDLLKLESILARATQPAAGESGESSPLVQ